MREKKLPSLKFCHTHQTRQWHFGTRPDRFAYRGEQTWSKAPGASVREAEYTHSHSGRSQVMERGHAPSSPLPALSATARSSAGPEKTRAHLWDVASRGEGRVERSLKCAVRLRTVRRLLLQLPHHFVFHWTRGCQSTLRSERKHKASIMMNHQVRHLCNRPLG